MLRASQALFYSSYLCVVLFCANDISAQEPITKPDFGDGVLEEVADKMENLLQLEWKGDNIALKRDWDEREEKKKSDDDEEKDEKDEIKKRIEELVDKGFPEEHARRLAEARDRRGRKLGFGMDRERSGVEKAFLEIPPKHGGRSSGSSGSGARRRLSFSTSAFSGSAILSNDDLRFAFEENDLAERKFELRDTGDGKVQFTFTYGELFLKFLQTEKGKIQLIWIDSDKADVYVASSFTEFVKKHPQPANKFLFPLLKQLGIKMPIDKTGPRLLSAALAHLERMQTDIDDQVAKLVKDLDSDSYETRNSASAKLTAGFEKWAGQIEKHLKESPLSPEARMRLKQIKANSGKNELDQFLGEHKLLSSPSFLIKLLEFAKDDQKLMVVDELKKVTNEDHGENLDAWKKWLIESDKQ